MTSQSAARARERQREEKDKQCTRHMLKRICTYLFAYFIQSVTSSIRTQEVVHTHTHLTLANHQNFAVFIFHTYTSTNVQVRACPFDFF